MARSPAGESAQFDSNEVRLSDYDNTLDSLNERMKETTKAITEKLQFHEKCD